MYVITYILSCIIDGTTIKAKGIPPKSEPHKIINIFIDKSLFSNNINIITEKPIPGNNNANIKGPAPKYSTTGL